MSNSRRQNCGPSEAMKPEFNLPKRAASRLVSLAREFRPKTRKHFRPYGVWRRLDNNGIWMNFLCQVVVAGGSKPWDKLEASPEAMKLLRFGSLRRQSAARQSITINRLFREHSVRYASDDRSRCRKTAAVVANLERLASAPGGPKGYLKELCRGPEDGRVKKIATDFRYIKLKGSRDLSAGLGLAKNVIGLDVRLLTLLRLVKVDIPKRVQTSSDVYKAVHDALLRQVCRPIGITGAQLDRILYNNYDEIKVRLTNRTRSAP